MDVRAAQREMREVYANGSLGQATSAAVWLVSAALATWLSVRSAILALVVGGMFIFPITQLILAARGRRVSVSDANPLRPLAPQVAFIVPLVMPLAGAATLYRTTWFYPAFMVIVGAHYLPFAFLYGRRAFLVLGGVLVAAGIGLAFSGVDSFSLGGWLTSGILAAFVIISRGHERPAD